MQIEKLSSEELILLLSDQYKQIFILRENITAIENLARSRMPQNSASLKEDKNASQ